MARPGVRIPPVTLYSDQEEVESAFKKATKPWICYTCKRPYRLLEAMGSLECQQHPGFVQENGVWSCCGQKMYPVRWAENIDVQRLFVGKGCIDAPPNVRGCQPCDHNTSNKPWDHTDATELASLSALLPFMNKEFPFVLRKGFDETQGILRRCKVRELRCPPVIDAVVTYLTNDGGEKEHVVTWYEDTGDIVYKNNNTIQRIAKDRVIFAKDEGAATPNGKITLPKNPQGMELRAVRPDKSVIKNWW
tara:strand:+ start:92 stop:835 length:744 start_codon:yes stop_codon:yes gene_type:complete